MSELLKAPEVAQQLGITPRTLRRWSRTGQGPAAVRVGTRYLRYRSEDVQKWICSQRVAA